MDELHHRQLIEHYLQAYNRFDIDAMLAVRRTTYASRTTAAAS
ncbi:MULTISPECIES: hypothetical protein [Stenotrophomonas maltophilia group]|nr:MULTISPECIES: hypothetical protein [Stenotrophomonas maltophilia group]